MRRSVGAVLLGFQNWSAERISGRQSALPTEYCHYEGAVAFTHGLPILGVLEKGTERSGIFTESGLELVLLPENADLRWLDARRGSRVRSRTGNDSSSSAATFSPDTAARPRTAGNIKQYLMTQLELTVLDWQEDFAPAEVSWTRSPRPSDDVLGASSFSRRTTRSTPRR
jgi:hypothetical protein